MSLDVGVLRDAADADGSRVGDVGHSGQSERRLLRPGGGDVGLGSAGGEVPSSSQAGVESRLVFQMLPVAVIAYWPAGRSMLAIVSKATFGLIATASAPRRRVASLTPASPLSPFGP